MVKQPRCFFVTSKWVVHQRRVLTAISRVISLLQRQAMHPPPLDRVEQKVVESLAWHVTRLLDTTDPPAPNGAPAPWCPWS